VNLFTAAPGPFRRNASPLTDPLHGIWRSYWSSRQRLLTLVFRVGASACMFFGMPRASFQDGSPQTVYAVFPTSLLP